MKHAERQLFICCIIVSGIKASRSISQHLAFNKGTCMLAALITVLQSVMAEMKTVSLLVVESRLQRCLGLCFGFGLILNT